MFGLYHILESLVSHSTDEDACLKTELLSLQHLSARVIVGYRRNCLILSNTPVHLHTILWKAYLRDTFYSNNESKWDEKHLYRLSELLYHWPHEEFSLRNVMPSFPPKLDWYYGFPFNRNGLLQNRKRLTDFYTAVALTIAKAFNIDHNYNDTFIFHYIYSEQHKSICNIKKIDITGFHDFMWNDFKLVLNNFVNLEVILDVMLNEDEFKEFVLQEACLIKCFHNSPNSVIIKFGFVTLCGWTESQLIENIINSNQVNITGLALVNINGFGKSLNLFQYLQNLVHLNVSGYNLHGLLESFRFMQKGLLYLNISCCSIENADLEHLINSSHALSLKELDLGNNDLSFDSDSGNLIQLCESLSNVLFLDLSFCNLKSWPIDVIESLFYSFSMMPSIISLNLYSIRYDNSINILSESSSLRYLKISLSAEIESYITYINTVCDVFRVRKRNDIIQQFYSKVDEIMNKNRSQLLFCDFGQ